MYRNHVKYILLVICRFIITIHHVCSESSMQDANEIFAAGILGTVISNSSLENVIISPFYIQRLMTLTMYGARGPLIEEIKNVLHLESLEEDDYLNYYKQNQKDFININKVYFSQALNVRKMFSIAAEKHFDITIEAIDFRDAKQSVKKINAYVEKESNKLMRKFIDVATINKSVKLMFLNAVCFRGQWEQPFETSSVRIGKFFNWGKTEADVTALYSVQLVGYAEMKELKLKALQLPYKNSSVKLLIILPTQGSKSWLNVGSLSGIIESLHVEAVAISLPKFQIDKHMDLSKTLANLGMTTLFSTNANFLNAFQEMPDSMNFQVLHEVMFEVNEFGSNLNLKTEGEILKNQMPAENKLIPKKFFVVERPFVFVLHTNGNVLLAGRINALNNPTPKPTKEEISAELRSTLYDENNLETINESSQKVSNSAIPSSTNVVPNATVSKNSNTSSNSPAAKKSQTDVVKNNLSFFSPKSKYAKSYK